MVGSLVRCARGSKQIVATVENGLEQGEGQHCRDRCRRELMLSPENGCFRTVML